MSSLDRLRRPQWNSAGRSLDTVGRIAAHNNELGLCRKTFLITLFGGICGAPTCGASNPLTG
jgi:hypothetical protein